MRGFDPAFFFFGPMYLKGSIKDYLDELSSASPIPGGGGTSALVAALGIGLVLMVARITLKRLDGRKKTSLSRTIDLLERLRRDSEQTIDLDPKVYRQVMASYARLKKSGNSKKAQAEVESALANSFRLQADLALLVVMAKQLLTSVAAFAKGSIRNDLVVASGLLDSAFRGGWATARINVVYMKQGKQRRHFERALAKLEQKYRKIRFD